MSQPRDHARAQLYLGRPERAWDLVADAYAAGQGREK